VYLIRILRFILTLILQVLILPAAHLDVVSSDELSLLKKESCPVTGIIFSLRAG
jgi:hypothetical protein